MNNNLRINPIGLKGAEINDRMKELMGITPIVEHKSSPVVELTKIGPDGHIYAVIRENHKYYIKTTNKTENVVSEDFQYIGGLQNKTQEAYPSYAKAIKHLNLKFNSIAEALNVSGNINVFQDDNLITESGVAGFSTQTSSGFSGQGNLAGNNSLYEEKEMEDETAPISEYFAEEEETIEEVEDDELTESEKAIMEMDDNEEIPDNPEDYREQPGYVHEEEAITESHLSIKRALQQMDSIIDSLTEVKKKVYTLK